MTQITGTRFLPYDLLHEQFGPAHAQQIIDAPGSLGEEYPNNDD